MLHIAATAAGAIVNVVLLPRDRTGRVYCNTKEGGKVDCET